MTNGTDGGVLHLLRLTRTQCHAWVAFVALRRGDGTIEITAVPGADDESLEWTPETLQGIVRQTLEDPLIGEGRAVIRVSEVFRRYWPGERQYTRMAVAPLNDVSGPGRPWGLLCALDPVDGQFSEAQLDMLGRLAVRFINHLRVRRQFVEDVSASEAMLTAALPQELPAPHPAPAPRHAPEPSTGPPEAPAGEDIVRIGRAANWLPPQADDAPRADESTEAVAPEDVPPASLPAGQPEADAEPHAPEVEVVFGEAIAVEVAGPAAERAPAGIEVPADEGVAVPEKAAADATASPPPGTPVAPVRDAGGAPGVRPLRRVRLSELIDQLDETLDRLAAARRHGALVLVELPAGIGAESGRVAEAAAGRLAEATRHSDVVLGVGSDMLAVVMELGPRPADLELIGERLRAASGTGNTAEPLRSSVLSLDPGAGAGGEAIVLAAVRGLGRR